MPAMRPRPFALAVAAVCLAANALACRIIDPIVIPFPPLPPHPPPVQPIVTRAHSADVVVKDQSAEVSVNATFYNPNDARLEGTYWFPLPRHAAVKGFSMRVNGKDVKAELLDADRARETYEDIVRRRKDPALLEWIGAGMLKCRVFPMEPRSETQVSLTYSQLLEEDAGMVRLSYPLRSARPEQGAIGEMVVKVQIETVVPLKTVYSPTHTFQIGRKDDRHALLTLEEKQVDPSRDIEILFSRDARDVGLSAVSHKPADEDGYFLLSVSPGVEPGSHPKARKDVVFVFDTSGSMNADHKIQQAKNALKFCVGSLGPEDRFNILTFSGDVRPFREEMAPATRENVEQAQKHVDGLEALGGTALQDAVLQAFSLLATPRGIPMAILLTDGNPTIGERDPDAILKSARGANRSRSRLFVFGVGYDVNTRLLDTLADDARGTREYVAPNEDIETKVSALYAKLANPVLSDLKLKIEGCDTSELYPRAMPDLFYGGQITVLGRFKAAGKIAATLSGRLDNEEQTYRQDLVLKDSTDDAYLPRLWALRKVAFLLDEIRLRGENRELTDEIARLGKRHGILTPYTSFLIVEEDTPVPAAQRREILNSVQAAPGRFLGAREGRGAVADSAAIAVAKGAGSFAGDAGAPQVLGMAAAAGGSDEMEDRISDAARRTIRTLDGRTFYVKADGLWVESLCEERAREAAVIALWSDEFFHLVRLHPDIGRILTETRKVVLRVDGRILRIE